MNIDWKVGDLVKRVSANMLSSMPMGLGIVTQVDPEDEDQPVCIDNQHWPYLEDIRKMTAVEEKP